jgi:pimeloyl-ACP methyl ester carboxylesterase
MYLNYYQDINNLQDRQYFVNLCKDPLGDGGQWDMAKDIVRINKPTLLIWGLNDTITPPHVGHEFNSLIPGSELQFIDRCCHAPMMERPDEFNVILQNWLDKNPL